MIMTSHLRRALVAAAMFALPAGVATAETISTGQLGFQVNISESAKVLDSPGDMHVAMMEAWQSQHALLMYRNEPYIEIFNSSETASITQMSFFIGDTTANFDWAKITKTVKADVLDPDIEIDIHLIDQIEGGLRGDTIELTFLNFKPGASVRFRVDLDADSPDMFPSPDYREVFFDPNGSDASDNALVEITFDDLNNPNFGDPRTLIKLLDDYAIDKPTLFGPGFRSYSVMDHVRSFAVADLTSFEEEIPGAEDPPPGGENPPPGDTVSLPEPSTWALGIVGLLAIGAARIRRR